MGGGEGVEDNGNNCLAPAGDETSFVTFLGFFVPPDGSWARPVGKVGGEVKLSISYKNNKLFIMVMHIRGLVSTHTQPSRGSVSFFR